MYWQFEATSFEGVMWACWTRFRKLVKFNGHAGGDVPARSLSGGEIWRAFVRNMKKKARERKRKFRRDIREGFYGLIFRRI